MCQHAMTRLRVGPRLVSIIFVVAFSIAAQPSVARTVSFADSDLAAVARGVAPGKRLELREVPLVSAQPPATLELTRFQVFKRTARIHVDDGAQVKLVEPPATAYFRGTVAGEPGSWAVVSVRADGSVRALVGIEERLFVAGPEVGAPVSSRVVREVDPASFADLVAAWSCGFDQLPKTAVAGQLDPSALLSAPQLAGGPYAVDVAVDTDWELYNLFGSVEAATEYVGDLFAGVSAVYQRDVDTYVQVSDLFLYTGGAASDPWNATSLQTALTQLRNYWLASRSEVLRTTVHWLSARVLSGGGGIANLGVLCNALSGYGLSTNISGGYNPGNATTVWDIYVVSHELGHNFNSVHTHCYNNRPNPGDPPIDMCYGLEANCYSGAAQMPAGGGSIMSYCQLFAPGVPNVNLWLGRAGFYGHQSQRVSDQISSYVQTIAFCLPEPEMVLFDDGFESGNTSAWSATFP